MYSSGASFAREFRAWWDGQQAFRRQSDLASSLDASPVSVRMRLAGRSFPREAVCAKLYAITQLDCFGSRQDKARAEHERLVPSTVKKQRRSEYQANRETRCERSRAAWRKRYKNRRQFVSERRARRMSQGPAPRDDNSRRQVHHLPGMPRDSSRPRSTPRARAWHHRDSVQGGSRVRSYDGSALRCLEREECAGNETKRAQASRVDARIPCTSTESLACNSSAGVWQARTTLESTGQAAGRKAEALEAHTQW
jgi:hypothetical protein